MTVPILNTNLVTIDLAPESYSTRLLNWASNNQAVMWVYQNTPTYINNWTKDSLGRLSQQSKGTETYYRFDFSTRYFYVIPRLQKDHFIADADLIRKFLFEERNGDTLLFGFQNLIAPTTGVDNLLLSKASEHGRLRKPLDHSFTPRALSNASLEMAEIGLDILEAGVSNNSIKTLDYVFRVVCQIALGIHELEIRALSDHLEAYKNFPTESNKNDLVWNLKSIYMGGRTLIPGRGVAHLEKAKKEKSISENEEISSLITVLVAGIHTTDQFINFLIKELLSHPTYIEKLNREWEEFVTTHTLKTTTKKGFIEALVLFALGGEKDGVKIEGSKLLMQCYCEVQRLYPIIPDIKRVAMKVGEVNGFRFSEGDEIHLNIFKHQRNQKIWGPDADTFRPERFEDKELQSKLYSFSLGTQSCIGKYLVQKETLIFMAELFICFNAKPKNWDVDLAYDNFNLRTCKTVYNSKTFEIKPEYEHVLR